uniref:RING-type domain-containing protein n=1 Tax=Glossina brevipalpis TaxID=37001 RepID=A0A1A9VZJ3_9MUSC
MPSSRSPSENRSSNNNYRFNNRRQHLYNQRLRTTLHIAGRNRFPVLNSNESNSDINEWNNSNNINGQRWRGTSTSSDSAPLPYSNNRDNSYISYSRDLVRTFTDRQSSSRSSLSISNSYATDNNNNRRGERRRRYGDQLRRRAFRERRNLHLTMPSNISFIHWRPYWGHTHPPDLLLQSNTNPNRLSRVSQSTRVLNTRDIRNSSPSYRDVQTQWHAPVLPGNLHAPIYLLYYAALYIDRFYLPELENEILPRGLTSQEIDMLPSYVCNQDARIGYCTSCAVCLCDFELQQILRVLLCTHTFHAECVDKWLEMRGTCPICRAVCSPNQEQ